MTALEQRSATKFCGANKKSRQETFEMFKTPFGNNAMKKAALYKWYSKFEQGNSSVTDEPRPGRPSSISTKKIETVKELLNSDCRMTIREITIRTGHAFGTVFRIIHNELGIRRIYARWCCFGYQVLRLDLIHAMRKKRPGMLQTAILHLDNAPSHRAAPTTKTIKRLGFELSKPPPHSFRLGPL